MWQRPFPLLSPFSTFPSPLLGLSLPFPSFSLLPQSLFSSHFTCLLPLPPPRPLPPVSLLILSPPSVPLPLPLLYLSSFSSSVLHSSPPSLTWAPPSSLLLPLLLHENRKGIYTWLREVCLSHHFRVRLFLPISLFFTIFFFFSTSVLLFLYFFFSI